MPPARERERQVLDQQPVSVPLGEALYDYDLLAQPLRHRDEDLGAPLGLLRRLLAQLLVAGDARLALRLPRPGRHPDPLQLVLQRLLAGGGLLLLLGEPLLLLLEPGGVVPLPRDASALIQLQDPARHVVEEVAIVGHRHDGALELGEEALEPPHALGVEVVRRLVEQQHVGLLQQEPAERHAAALAAGDLAHVGLARREPERVHREVDLVVQLPEAERVDPLLEVALLLQQPGHLVVLHRLGEPGADVVVLVQQRLLLLHAVHDVAADVLLRVELRLLRQKPDAGAGERSRVTEEVLVHARHDAQERRFARAVCPEDADLGARVEGEVDALEDLAGGGHDLSEVAHREDVFAGHGGTT